ncbi:MAG TPA: PSD1 and planctomycete cytochrome C domain-containing protein, partial [Isosphaeraceae bacterium]|nr:PSD1 and planctomycete cytochrome C domain-containing protein [Isosphaeraceae bacterium]
MATLAPSAPSTADESHPALERDVLPLLKARCLKCHSPLKSKGKLNLSGPRSLARGGSSGPVIAPGNLDESTLWDLVSNDEMPPRPEEPLSADEKRLLRRWIEQGARDLPTVAEVQGAPPANDHWAFAPATTPPPPSLKDHRRVRTPIDRFIENALEDQKLALGPEANRTTLIRRLSFDLTGLPPVPEQIAAFVADPASNAYEKLVEGLLASPRYGERWGKFWLDASGYADSNGYFSADTDRPLAYRYRDYVIRAFNADRPLDQIVREQLAGDELAGDRRGPEADPVTIDLLVATHFLRNGQDGTGESDGNPDEVRADKYAVLEGTIQIIGSSLLGLTLQCAKCHDHKFEPVTQQEYYQLQAILYPAFNVEHWVKPNDRIVIAGPRDEMTRWQVHEKVIDGQLEALERHLASGTNATKSKETLQRVIEAANARRWPNPGRIAWVGDVSNTPSEIPLLVRGNLATPGPKVGPGVLGILTDPENRYVPAAPFAGSSATGRRLALARWLTRPGSRPSALLARVLANRIWQQHFGTGLAATSDNLGYTGSPPTHPELLEWLASELVRSGWSAKALHRLIVTSSVYRQSSAPRPDSASIDPDNRLLSRYSLRRLDAEALRDAILAITGELNDRQGGPYVPTHRDGSGEVVTESAEGATRRSVYLQQRRTEITSLLDLFDAPSIVTTCTRRVPSTIPLQSLSLMNSDFMVN